MDIFFIFTILIFHISGFKVNPTFNKNDLPPDTQKWYDRIRVQMLNPSRFENLDTLASSNDDYKYGRALCIHVDEMKAILYYTGDEFFLETIYGYAEKMKDELNDLSILSYQGTVYETDGYLNWLYFYDPGYIGTDVHEMDEIMAHSCVAGMAYMFFLNQDVDPKYGQAVTFWLDYLQNHFEAKWRDRKGIGANTKVLEKDLTHPYVRWTAYHWYMYKMTGAQWYLTEADRRVGIINRLLIDYTTYTGDVCKVWDHRVKEENNKGYLGCQNFGYSGYTITGLFDLYLNGYAFDKTFITKLAVTIRDHFLDNGNIDFAPGVCGGNDIPPYTASTYDRWNREKFTYHPHWVLGGFDPTGKILRICEEVYNIWESGRENAPQRFLVPAGILISKLYLSSNNDDGKCAGKTNEEGACGYDLGRGVCLSSGVCLCSNDWEGISCQVPICPSCDPTSQICTAPDVCTCKNGYEGINCDPKCVPGCLGNSECIAPNICQCLPNWTGENCDINEGTGCNPACNDHQSCSSNDICVCKNGYKGDDCQIPKCLGEFECKENENCTSPNICACYKGWVSENCDVRDCYGHFSGVDCTECLYNWGGLSCNDYLVDPGFQWILPVSISGGVAILLALIVVVLVIAIWIKVKKKPKPLSNVNLELDNMSTVLVHSEIEEGSKVDF